MKSRSHPQRHEACVTRFKKDLLEVLSGRISTQFVCNLFISKVGLSILALL